ncbi:MAG: hypothetical protein H7329_15835, partial [Opitutaceae bacterium]|nr:hypothetical protein [Cytophagales bacterium]
MRKTFIIFLGIYIFFFRTSFAQVVNIPDKLFKSFLINNGVDKNGNGSIESFEALLCDSLEVSQIGIKDLTGLGSFVNLRFLGCDYNDLEKLNVSGNPNLEELSCLYNLIDT